MSQHQQSVFGAESPTAGRAGGPSGALAADVVVARRLIGVTAEELARQIGALPAEGGTRLSVRPALDLDGMVGALRTIVGWYGDQPGSARQPADLAGAAETDVDGILQDYLRLRSAWESRQADLIAARLSDAAEERPNIRPRALLVDDQSDILVVVAAFLHAYGFDVAKASDGDAALRVLADGKPVDLLVTDYAMPNMTGLELATQASERLPELAVLIISGHPDCDELACLPANMRLLAKPFRRAELFQHVTALVRGYEAVARRELV